MEIEITPAMIAAGEDALRAWWGGSDWYDAGALQILRAMLAAGDIQFVVKDLQLLPKSPNLSKGEMDRPKH